MNELTILCMYHQKELLQTNFYPFFNIQCGENECELKLKMQGDGHNNPISSQNSYWSEITGLYWAWKNIQQTKYIGLCSYRRFFNFKESSNPVKLCKQKDASAHLLNVSYEYIDRIFKEHDVILPIEYTYSKSVHRVCEINYNQKDFELLEAYISNHQPEYSDAYGKIMNKNKMIGHNMFIMKYEDFIDYCEWVFEILIPLSKVIDATNYPTNQIRVFGYMHELLLAVYIQKKDMKIKRSQILYVNDSISKVRFSSITYRLLCTIVYNLKKLLNSSI